MTGELEVHQPAGDLATYDTMYRLAQRIAKTEFVPRALQNRPDAILAAILSGREIGIGPMQSLQSINVIQGKPTLSAELMRALVFKAGHTIRVEEMSDTNVIVSGKRCDTGASETLGWDMERAKRAGLVKKGGGWENYPRAMLLARATSELCRMLFPDVLSGLSYTSEELGDEPVEADLTPSDAQPVQPEIEEAEVVEETADPTLLDYDDGPF